MARYDDYGRQSSDPNFGAHSEAPEPYMVDTSVPGLTYICYTDTPLRCIRRITQGEALTITEFSIGAWNDRATLTYQPVNTTVEIP